MTELNQENKKTISAFAAGLLVGALLVWIFTGDNAAAPADQQGDDQITVEGGTEAEANSASPDTGIDSPTFGNGSASVTDQNAGMEVTLNGANFPSEEGWVAVRSYSEGQLGSILGAARYSNSDGLKPKTISLLTPTISGRTYAIVFFSEDGNKTFNLDGDVQIDTDLTTFQVN
tara:strand:- start:3485 stop:4006 length:522 start_codon:yes stop_codon:yes gene_type:complete